MPARSAITARRSSRSPTVYPTACASTPRVLWVALYGGVVHRYLPAGVLLAVARLPVPSLTCPTFGGANSPDFYVTTAWAGMDTFESAIVGCDVCLISLETPAEPAHRSLEIARAHDVVTVLDPADASDEAATRRLLPLCDWVTPNEGEAAAMTSQSDATEAARALHELGASNVVVTLGGEGALLHTGNGAERIPARDVPCVDTSGAGDAFNAAFSLSLARGQPPAEAVRRGCIAGGLIGQGPGFVDALHLLDQFHRAAQS